AIEDGVRKMHENLRRQGLDIHDAQGPGIITGPNDFAQLIPASDGALYGRPTHGWLGSFKRPGATSKLSNLYLCGGSVHPGPGIPMATLSGKLAAEKLCQDFRQA
ncbi:MAG: CrtD protein, partial [Granulosicoccus sp.]